MGITGSNKELSMDSIECGSYFNIKLSLTATPDIVSNPIDIVLILDCSGSMSGQHLESLKNGAKEFIDIIDEATDAAKDGHIGSGSRIGIVSFSNTATQNTQMITSVSELKTVVVPAHTSDALITVNAFAAFELKPEISINTPRIILLYV